ncbi:MAG: hypothetical protein ACQEXE_14485 [Bacillota bacterium]
MKIKNVIGNVGKPEVCDKKLTALELKMIKSHIKIVPISIDHETRINFEWIPGTLRVY